MISDVICSIEPGSIPPSRSSGLPAPPPDSASRAGRCLIAVARFGQSQSGPPRCPTPSRGDRDGRSGGPPRRDGARVDRAGVTTPGEGLPRPWSRGRRAFAGPRSASNAGREAPPCHADQAPSSGPPCGARGGRPSRQLTPIPSGPGPSDGNSRARIGATARPFTSSISECRWASPAGPRRICCVAWARASPGWIGTRRLPTKR